MAAVVALLLSAVFGAGDQYAGSLTRLGPWATDASLLSAPWLVLPFLAGWAQRTPRRAALLGLACTATAFAAYGLMTLSPIEGARLTAATARGFAISEAPALLGGLVTGPLFGFFGHRWRVRRDLAAALTTAALVCLEPLARIRADRAIRVPAVWQAEVAAGLAMAAYAVVVAKRPSRTL